LPPFRQYAFSYFLSFFLFVPPPLFLSFFLLCLFHSYFIMHYFFIISQVIACHESPIGGRGRAGACVVGMGVCGGVWCAEVCSEWQVVRGGVCGVRVCGGAVCAVSRARMLVYAGSETARGGAPATNHSRQYVCRKMARVTKSISATAMEAAAHARQHTW